MLGFLFVRRGSTTTRPTSPSCSTTTGSKVVEAAHDALDGAGDWTPRRSRRRCARRWSTGSGSSRATRSGRCGWRSPGAGSRRRCSSRWSCSAARSRSPGSTAAPRLPRAARTDVPYPRTAARPPAAAAAPGYGRTRRARQPGSLASPAPAALRAAHGRHPHPEPRSYPLMLRTWDYALVEAARRHPAARSSAACFVVPLAADAGARRRRRDRGWLRAVPATGSIDVGEPGSGHPVPSMLYLNLGLASLILVAMGIVRVVHRLRPRWLVLGAARAALEVPLRLPRPRGGRADRLARRRPLLPDAAQRASPAAQRADRHGCVAIGDRDPADHAVAGAGEEYVFRGYLMQAFGSFVDGVAGARLAASASVILDGRCDHLGPVRAGPRRPELPAVLRPVRLRPDRRLLVVRTGGLEAGIALHILNNLLAFGVAIAFGDLDERAHGLRGLVVAAPGDARPERRLPACSCLVVARRMGLRSKTAPARAGSPRRPPVACRIEVAPASFGGRGRACVSLTLGSPGRPHASRTADPMGYGVIGSPTGSGPVSLGSSPSTPASTTIWLTCALTARVSSAHQHQQAPVV